MRRLLGRLVAGLASVLALGLLVPDRLGLTTTTPVTQVISFRSALGLGSLALGLLILLAVRARRRRAARARGRPVRRGARPASHRTGRSVDVLALVLIATGAVHVGVVAARGLVNVTPAALRTLGSQAPGGVTVLSFNTLTGAASPGEVADVAAASRADVLALPETTPEVAAEIADLLALRGMAMQVFANDRGYSTVFSTSLLVSEALGVYTEVATSDGAGFVRADPADGVGPPVVAVHPSAPIPGNMDWWEREVTYAVELCRQTPGALVAGDFNATLDHAPLRDLGRCADAASAPGLAGAGAYGTWHARLPALLGAPIDHVLFDREAWRVVSVAVAEVGGSDHRAVMARFAPIGQPAGSGSQ